ncbi:MAG: hypothetical protein HYZ49_06730 [Chloroflexi bacterium]|nr:hypothetical protein [Chloroflexota bacterium]
MPNPPDPLRPIRDLAVFFLVAFAGLGLATGYWNFVARESLVSRDDNPRTVILYNRIRRGIILDRNNAVLAGTTGEPGDYVRYYDTSAAQVLGYASFRYGLSGVEAAADSTLSGEEGLGDLERRWRHDLLGEPQVGRNVKLTLDLNLQHATFNALANRPGAIVVIDPHTGDLLALASSPSFDPAKLDADFESFTADANGPLINRAAAVYPAGNLLALFPSTLDLSSAPSLPIPTLAAEGDKVSPLQLALLAAALVNKGEMPAPRLIDAICAEALGGCAPQPVTGHPVAVIPPDVADELRIEFELNGVQAGLPLPGYAATLPSGFGDGTVGWFIGFAPDDSFAICVLLEDGTGEEAAQVAALALK